MSASSNHPSNLYPASGVAVTVVPFTVRVLELVVMDVPVGMFATLPGLTDPLPLLRNVQV